MNEESPFARTICAEVNIHDNATGKSFNRAGNYTDMKYFIEDMEEAIKWCRVQEQQRRNGSE